MADELHFILLVRRFENLYPQLCKDLAVKGIHVLDFGCPMEEANLYSATASTYTRIYTDTQNRHTILNVSSVPWSTSRVCILNLLGHDVDGEQLSSSALLESSSYVQGATIYPHNVIQDPMSFLYLTCRRIQYNTLMHFIWESL